MSSDEKFVPTDIPMILVLGETGAGKSYFINTLAPGTAVIGKGLESCTKELVGITTRIGNTDVMLIDTPGFDDTYLTDGEVLLELSTVLVAQYKAKINLMGVIYCYDITRARFTGSGRRQLELFRKICGDENLKHVLLVTTKWGRQENLDYCIREDELRDKHWAELIDREAQFMRFEGTYGSATSIASQLLGEQKVTLTLIRELVLDNKPLAHTDAGVFVVEQRHEMEEDYNRIRMMKHVPAAEKNKLVYLEECLEKSREDKEKLGADVVGNVDKFFQKEIEKAMKEQNKKPTAVNLITWILTLISGGLSVGNLLATLGAI